MILQEGDKILVVHRRLFETDSPRFFIGVVDGYENGIAKVSGTSWVKEQFGGTMTKKEDLRTKIFSLSSGTLIAYELPKLLDLRNVRFEYLKDGRLILRDNDHFKMDLAENEYGTAVKKSRT